MQTTTQIDFKRFCAKSTDPRLVLHAPFCRNGIEYATNGHILVARKTTLPDTEGSDAAPNVEFLNLFQPDEAYHPAPKLDLTPFTCKNCGTEGKVNCASCKGTGAHHCKRCERDHPCGKCDGLGLVKCDACEGEGIVSAEFLGRHVAAKYLRMIAEFEPLFASITGRDTTLYFRCGEVYGAVALVHISEG